MKTRLEGFPVKALAIGLCAGLAVSLGLLCGAAMLIGWGTIGQAHEGYVIAGVTLVSTLTGSAIACRTMDKNRALWAGIYAVLFWLAQMTLGWMLFGGPASGVWATGVLILGGSLAAAVLFRGRKHKPSHRSPGARKGRIVHYAQRSK